MWKNHNYISPHFIAQIDGSNKNKSPKTNTLRIQTTDDIVLEITNSWLPWLKSYALSLCHNNEADAEDLYQDTVVKILSNKSKFTLWSNFKARTITIMKNWFINSLRKKKNNPVYFTGNNTFHIDPSSVENNAPWDLEIEQLFTYISLLSTENRIPFEMRLTWYSYAEIAENLAIPIWTVKSRIFFARKELKNHILFDRYWL
jgi:RNA polymerase sigma-70 factor (ECF subfamily)